MSTALVPCPLCGSAPHRFRSGSKGPEVIACPKGCKPYWNSVVVHITSTGAAALGWSDLAKAWNTIEIWTDEHGNKRGRFHAPPSSALSVEVVGPYLNWSREISAAKATELAKRKTEIAQLALSERDGSR